MSMKEYLDENDTVNSIRLQLRHHAGIDKVWILVEGETDQKLFSKLINGDRVEVEISHGGVNCLLNIVSVLVKETNRILGIRDADFLHLEGKTENHKNIFLTDFHDAEMMIISCDDAYNAVTAEYLNGENKVVRKKILKSVAFIGGLRWLNETENLELNFKNLGFGDCYNQHSLLDEEKCLNIVMRRSPQKKKEISIEDVRTKIKKIKRIKDLLNLCNGHDFQKVFALYVNFNSNSTKNVNDTDIGKIFRVAYRFEDFQKSDLYRQLIEWADSNSMTIFK